MTDYPEQKWLAVPDLMEEGFREKKKKKSPNTVFPNRKLTKDTLI